MKKYILIAFILLNTLNSKNVFAVDISVKHGKYNDYYHIKYTLNKNNFIIPDGNKPQYSGQFEILLKKKYFPIKANKCNGDLILRMPSTLSSSKNKKENIDAKIKLLEEIKNVFEDKKESLDIIIELNPYVSVISKKPLKLELQYCNIFFRANSDMYINHL